MLRFNYGTFPHCYAKRWFAKTGSGQSLEKLNLTAFYASIVRRVHSAELTASGGTEYATVWLALTPATPSNGCMYALPACFDPYYHAAPTDAAASSSGGSAESGNDSNAAATAAATAAAATKMQVFDSVEREWAQDVRNSVTFLPMDRMFIEPTRLRPEGVGTMLLRTWPCLGKQPKKNLAAWACLSVLVELWYVGARAADRCRGCADVDGTHYTSSKRFTRKRAAI
jgi:hypothetical protein